MDGKWIKLSQGESGPGARSSHAITVVNNKAYVFGGEFTPRVPVDNELHVFNLQTHTWSTPPTTGQIPSPRVGVTMTSIGTTIYIFGGRDASHKELDEFYSFDTLTDEWTLLPSGPPHRSYHSMTSDEGRVYVFGGCGMDGRRNDLWAYDVARREWTDLPSPGKACLPRGGPGLVAAGGKVWVVYGFSGEELDDVHSFDLGSNTWAQVETTGDKPSPRSVFCTTRVGNGKYVVVYGGEVDPSDQGHLGAGSFSREVFVFDSEGCEWRRLDEFVDGVDHPGPRGWCAFDGAMIGGEDGLLVYGGNSPTNDRLGDIYFFAPRL